MRAVMPRTKSRPIRLSAADRQMLAGLVRTGSHPAQQVRRARFLLALDENDPDRDGPVPTQAVVAERVGVLHRHSGLLTCERRLMALTQARSASASCACRGLR